MQSSPDFRYARLAEALRRRLAVIADREFYQRDPAGHLSSLQSASAEVEQSAAELPRPIPPDLAHYLQRCSYGKALEFIETLSAD